jgi:hypothetical protein
MTKLLIDIPCGTEACGDCELLVDDTEHYLCLLFDTATLGQVDGEKKPPRCPACLAAERRSNASQPKKGQ